VERSRSCRSAGTLLGKRRLTIEVIIDGSQRLPIEPHTLSLAPLDNPAQPFPWMSETLDLGKEKNFFEIRVTEYRSGASLELGLGSGVRPRPCSSRPSTNVHDHPVASGIIHALPATPEVQEVQEVRLKRTDPVGLGSLLVRWTLHGHVGRWRSA
jgi:hypothetical protein